MGNHRGGQRYTNRKKTGNTPPPMTLRHRVAQNSGPQRPEPKSPTPTSESLTSEDSWSSNQTTTPRSPTPTSRSPTPTSRSPSPEPVKNISTTDKIKSTRIPPILVQTSQETPWRKIAKVLYTIQGLEQLAAKTTLTPMQIQLNCPEENSFRVVQKFLTENKINYHTFTFPEQKSLKIAIKGIPFDITEEEVMEELTLIGFKPNFVRAFQKDGKRLPIHMISLNRTENVKDIFDTQDLFYVRVKVEPYKTSGPAQCFSCQRFGHSSLQCGHTPRCVKCAGDHPTKSCEKSKEKPATCCNCNGNHTANYHGCSFYTELSKTKQTQKPNLPTTQEIPTETKPHQNKSTQETPTTIKALQNKSTEKIRSYSEVTNHLKNEPTVNASKILIIVRDLLSTIQHCTDSVAKDAILKTVLNIINSINHDE